MGVEQVEAGLRAFVISGNLGQPDGRDDVPAGLVALNRVAQDLPGHVPTLMKLADLYARDGQATEAVDRLNRVLAFSSLTGKPVSVELALFIVFAILFGLVLHRTRWGRAIYAIGANPVASNPDQNRVRRALLRAAAGGR